MTLQLVLKLEISQAGTKIEYGLDKDAVGLSEHQDNISKDVLAKVEEYKQKIVDGDIKVPEKP